jgi:hypothetical protein
MNFASMSCYFFASTMVVFPFDYIFFFFCLVHFLSHFHWRLYELTSHLGGKALSCGAKA